MASTLFGVGGALLERQDIWANSVCVCAERSAECFGGNSMSIFIGYPSWILQIPHSRQLVLTRVCRWSWIRISDQFSNWITTILLSLCSIEKRKREREIYRRSWSQLRLRYWRTPAYVTGTSSKYYLIDGRRSADLRHTSFVRGTQKRNSLI